MSRPTPLTIRLAAVKITDGAFFVHYAQGTELWSSANRDDAMTLADARELASARQGLGYRTKITEKKTGTELT